MMSEMSKMSKCQLSNVKKNKNLQKNEKIDVYSIKTNKNREKNLRRHKIKLLDYKLK